jgi:hypothetical protein
VKVCFKCGTEKPLGDFYKHAQMADGHLNKCKACTKLDMRNDRHTKPRVREYDRNRAALPHRRKLAASVTRSWRHEHPERVRAHNMAARADIDSPECCEGCGLARTLEKHHPDYSKPLLIVWLCKPCHAIADKIRRRLEAS